jgi:biotin carboxyl carrier protein
MGRLVELIARVGDRVEHVSVERDGAGYHVRVGERRYEIDHRALGPWVRSLIVDGESHEAAVFRAGDESWSVGWRGRTTVVELVDPLTHLAAEAHGEAKRSGKHVVVAYMPGRVVSVAVEEGATVEPGQPLVVLEAMKMQNEIQADRTATVRRIHVRPGQAVEGGDPLVELA